MIYTETGTLAVGGTEIPYTIRRSKRRRRSIGLLVESEKNLRITAPLKTSLFYIETVIHRRAHWIIRKMGEIKARPPANDETAMVYLGHACALHVSYDPHIPQGCRLKPGRLHVNIHGRHLSEKDRREEIRLETMLWCKKRARVKFQKRLDFWAERLGVRYNRLVVSSPQKLWGSCSADNTIRLNWQLVMAPLPLLDYVVAHELAHVVHKNHSQRFWGFLAKTMPDYKARRKELRKFGPRLAL
ncbi:MAG: SprT family zinc-dependent metalloprotease [Alphaproteobacteria bacterium]